MASYGAGDPLEHLRTELLEVLGKAEELTEIIYHLCQFLEKISKTLRKPPRMTWMDKIKKDDDLYGLQIFFMLYCSPRVLDSMLIDTIIPIINDEIFHCSICNRLMKMN